MAVTVVLFFPFSSAYAHVPEPSDRRSDRLRHENLSLIEGAQVEKGAGRDVARAGEQAGTWQVPFLAAPARPAQALPRAGPVQRLAARDGDGPGRKRDGGWRTSSRHRRTRRCSGRNCWILPGWTRVTSSADYGTVRLGDIVRAPPRAVSALRSFEKPEAVYGIEARAIVDSDPCFWSERCWVTCWRTHQYTAARDE